MVDLFGDDGVGEGEVGIDEIGDRAIFFEDCLEEKIRLFGEGIVVASVEWSELRGWGDLGDCAGPEPLFDEVFCEGFGCGSI